MMTRLMVLCVMMLALATRCLSQVKPDSDDYDCEASSPHNYTFGERISGDRLLYSTISKVDGMWFMVEDATVSWPLKGQISKATISSVKVENRMEDEENSGCAYLVDGGPGQSHVELYVLTQRGSGADFMINVYGNGF